MFALKRSRVDLAIVEIWEGGRLVEEVLAPYKTGKFPPPFASVEEAKGWLLEKERFLAKRYAYFLLGRRNYSAKDLQKKLLQKGYSAKAADALIEECKGKGYLNDEEFFERAIFREFRKGKGPRYIAMKLRISLEEVRKRISVEQEREAIARLFKGKKGLKTAAKLQRSGFDLELISEAMR